MKQQHNHHNRPNRIGDVLLISEELLKLYSPISRNVSVDKLYPFVHLAQPYYLVPVLGGPLTEELQEQVESNSLTKHNKALIVKIAMPLAMWTTYLAMRSLGYTVTEKGITKEKSENSESISRTEMADYLMEVKRDAEMATELLIKHLCECKYLYPKWRPTRPCDCAKYLDGEGTNKRAFHASVFFPGAYKQSGCDCMRDHRKEERHKDLDEHFIEGEELIIIDKRHFEPEHYVVEDQLVINDEPKHHHHHHKPEKPEPPKKKILGDFKLLDREKGRI